MALYRVQGNGKAPAGLQAGDEVVTGGGTYRILGVNADGSYRSSLSNKYQTIYNYRGSYGTAPAGQTDTAQVRTPGYTPSGAASEAKAALDRVLSEKPGSYTSRWDSELDALYDQIANRKAFSYDLGGRPDVPAVPGAVPERGTAGDGKHDGRGGVSHGRLRLKLQPAGGAAGVQRVSAEAQRGRAGALCAGAQSV